MKNIYHLRLLGCSLMQGNDDLYLPIEGETARAVVDLARTMATLLKRGQVQVVRADNLMIASFNCWQWE